MPGFPIRTKEIEKDIFAVRSLICNFYVVRTRESLIVFDSGISRFLANLGMKKLGLDPAKVESVFLTHSDFDHTGGLKPFKNAKLYLPEKELPLIKREKARKLFVYNRRLKNYNTLDDRENVRVGDANIQIISAPGHTTGSCCYIINEDILVSGDTIMLSRAGRIKPFSIIQNMNHAGNKATVERLRAEGIFERARLILTGHSGILTKTNTEV